MEQENVRRNAIAILVAFWLPALAIVVITIATGGYWL